MVKLDLGVKEILGLADIGSVSKKDLEKHLYEFDQKDLVEYLLSQSDEEGEAPEKEEEPGF